MTDVNIKSSSGGLGGEYVMIIADKEEEERRTTTATEISQQKIPGSVKKWKVPGTKCITTVKHPIKKKNALSKDHGELQRKVLND